MDFNVSIGETDSLMTESAPNPAGIAAREEYVKILSDPTHPHHDGLKRNSKAANDYVTELYRKAYSNAPATIEDGLSVTTGGPDDVSALSAEDAQAMAALRQEWGTDYEAHLGDAQFGSSRLARVLGGEVDDLTAAVLAAGGDLKLILNIARHFGKQARTYAP